MKQYALAALPGHAKPRKKIGDTLFFRRNGILLVVLLAVILWTGLIWIISGHVSAVKTTKALTARYDLEYEARMQEFQNELIELNTPTEDEQLAAQMEREAEAIARAVGPMKTRNMKLTMCWNILARVDSPYYPDTVEDVVNQPQQWMFYDAGNPVRDDDVELVLEQVRLWHQGRYPAKFSNAFVYAEWSSNDYQLRDTWEKTSRTEYWRYPE